MFFEFFCIHKIMCVCVAVLLGLAWLEWAEKLHGVTAGMQSPGSRGGSLSRTGLGHGPVMAQSHRFLGSCPL